MPGGFGRVQCPGLLAWPHAPPHVVNASQPSLPPCATLHCNRYITLWSLKPSRSYEVSCDVDKISIKRPPNTHSQCRGDQTSTKHTLAIHTNCTFLLSLLHSSHVQPTVFLFCSTRLDLLRLSCPQAACLCPVVYWRRSRPRPRGSPPCVWCGRPARRRPTGAAG